MADASNLFGDLVPQQQQQPGGGMFDDLVPQQKPAGLLRNFAAGANRTLADIGGAPIDASRWVLNHASQAAGLSSAEKPLIPSSSFGGSESIKKGMNWLGIDTDVQPQTRGERLVSGAGSGAMGVATLPLGATESLARYVGTTLLGLFGGGTGKAVSEVAPEPLKPTADVLGNFAGALGSASLYQAGRSLFNTVADRAAQYLAPWTSEGTQRLAGQKLTGAASNSRQVLDRIAAGQDPQVPGSQPTTFQATGDPGLGQLERSVATRTPEDFVQRRAQQNAARTGAIDALAPEGSSSQNVGQFFSRQLQAIDRAAQVVEDATSRHAASTLDRLGPAAAPDAAGQQTALQSYGSRLRNVVSGANDAAKKREDGLWRALDPGGTMTVGTGPIRTTAARVAQDIAQNARPMEGEEAAIFKLAASQPQTQSLSEVQALRSRLLAAMREERYSNGNTPALARMTRLLGGVHGALEEQVSNVAAQQAQAVAQGTMAAEQTMQGRLAAEAQRWRNERSSVAAGRDAGAGPADASGAGPQAVRGAPGANVPPAGGPGNVAGGAGVSAPSFDAAAAQRYAAARDATRERIETFEQGSPGKVLARGQTSGSFKLPESQIAPTIFNSGKRAAEDISQFLAASGNHPDAISALHDYAAFDLRRVAERDGALNRTAYDRWMQRHETAIDAVPGLRQKLADVGAAQQAVESAAALRASSTRAYENSAASHFLGGTDPIKAVAAALSTDNPQSTFRQLATLTASSQPARDGLKRAVVDFIHDRFISNTEAGTSGLGQIKADQLQTFVRRNAPALGQIFSPEEVSSLRAVAADLQRANRSIVSTKLPGGSNTPQDLAAAARYGNKLSVLGRVLATAGGATLEHLAGGTGLTGGTVGYFGNQALSAMRQAGMTKVDDLVKEALLNPDLAATLMRKAMNPAGQAYSARVAREIEAGNAGTRQLQTSRALGEQSTQVEPRDDHRDLSAAFQIYTRRTPDVAPHQAAAQWLIARGNQTGHEAMVVQSRDGRRFVEASTNGNARSVWVSQKAVDAAARDPVVIQHNHPNNTALSAADHSLLAEPGVDTIVAWAGDGHMAAARLTAPTERALQGRSVEQRANILDLGGQHIRGNVNQVLLDAVNRGETTLADANLLSSQIADHALARLGIIDYVNSRPITAPQPVVDRAFRVAIAAAQRVATAAGLPTRRVGNAILDRSAVRVSPEDGMARILGRGADARSVPSGGQAGGPRGTAPPQRSRRQATSPGSNSPSAVSQAP